MPQPVQIPITSPGQLLSAYRGAAGLTQHQLALQVGAHAKSIHNWETNQTIPDAHLWARIVEALNIPHGDAILIWRTHHEA